MSSPIRLGFITASDTEAAYTASADPYTDVFTTDLTALADCAVRMTVAVDAAVSIFRREDGENIDIGQGVPMVANVEQTFLFDMTRDTTFNIRFDGNCNILKMTVFEVNEGVV
jgi:hypothetical protein